MRLMLALLVILSHSPELIDGDRHREILTSAFGTISFGEFAVDVFFLLSGYLIMQSWDLQPRAWLFLRKRFLRIYPGFLVASVICALLVGPVGANPTQYFDKFDGLAFLTSAMLLQVPAVPAAFLGTNYPIVNGALWTISFEFVCYLIVLILGASGLLRRRHAWLAVTVIVFSAFAAFRLKNTDTPHLLRLTVFFFSGACFYIYRDSIRLSGRISIACLVPLSIGLLSWRGAELALATFGAYVLLYMAHKRSALLVKFNRLPDVSYGIYLYGWPTQKLIIWYFPAISPWVLFAVASLISLLMGYLSWHLVEKPMLKFKRVAPRLVESPSAP